MLERNTELIERLLRGSLTRTREFNQALAFTNDGTLYFTVWDKDGTTFSSVPHSGVTVGGRPV